MREHEGQETFVFVHWLSARALQRLVIYGGDCACLLVVSINNQLRRNVTLKVGQPPVILDNSTQSVTALEGQEVELLCEASGIPQPQVSWMRKDNASLPNGSIAYNGNRLKFNPIKLEDRGIYHCVADNGIGEAVLKNVALDVKSKCAKKTGQSYLLCLLF